MQSMPTGEGKDGRGTKHTIDASQLGSRDAGEFTLNRKGLLMKTDDELLDEIRQSALAIRDASDEIPLVGSMTIAEIQRLESYANALRIYCKLLRQRLEAGQTTLTEGE